MLAQLGRRGAASVSDLAEPFDMALPSFMQHLHVLEDTGLVKSKKKGRARYYQLVPRTLKVAETWLDKQRSLWEQRLDQLDEHLAQMKEETK